MTDLTPQEREWTLEGRGDWPGSSRAREGELVDPPKDARTIVAFWVKPSPILAPDEKVIVVPKSRAEAAEARVAEANRRANGAEVLLAKQSERIKHLQNRVQSERRKGANRLQQAQEALREIKYWVDQCEGDDSAARFIGALTAIKNVALAALAGEDDG